MEGYTDSNGQKYSAIPLIENQGLCFHGLISFYNCMHASRKAAKINLNDLSNYEVVVRAMISKNRKKMFGGFICSYRVLYI